LNKNVNPLLCWIGLNDYEMAVKSMRIKDGGESNSSSESVSSLLPELHSSNHPSSLNICLFLLLLQPFTNLMGNFPGI
jgi:hypothetical protein